MTTNFKKHKSFRRSYREDYLREFKSESAITLALNSFKILFKNWKLFLPLLLISVTLFTVLVGLMSESTYKNFQSALDSTSGAENLGGFARAGLILVSAVTTGGFSAFTEVSTVFLVLIFIFIWLTTIYFLRRLKKHEHPTLREGLYNSLAPFVSTLIVLCAVIVDLIPVFALTIVYSTALKTNFLSTPFYALIFLILAALLIILSLYLLSRSLIALVAVSAPGLYPFVAISTANKLPPYSFSLARFCPLFDYRSSLRRRPHSDYYARHWPKSRERKPRRLPARPHCHDANDRLFFYLLRHFPLPLLPPPTKLR